ncbi:hypothetical protein BDZ91DRAFT_734457 [Kalaharituber pfeilii]|nr:hypothetical protein BDZ91DRAFT_734457 [Kalaharituber pfeilii]
MGIKLTAAYSRSAGRACWKSLQKQLSVNGGHEDTLSRFVESIGEEQHKESTGSVTGIT